MCGSKDIDSEQQSHEVDEKKLQVSLAKELKMSIVPQTRSVQCFILIALIKHIQLKLLLDPSAQGKIFNKNVSLCSRSSFNLPPFIIKLRQLGFVVKKSPGDRLSIA